MSLEEKDKKLGEALARVRDGLQGLQSAIEAIDGFLNYLGKPLDPEHPEVYDKPTWDPGKIKWSQEEGAKGPFEKSEDVNSSDFKNLIKDLNAHKGKLYQNGWFMWLYSNGATVGRKKKA